MASPPAQKTATIDVASRILRTKNTAIRGDGPKSQIAVNWTASWSGSHKSAQLIFVAKARVSKIILSIRCSLGRDGLLTRSADRTDRAQACSSRIGRLAMKPFSLVANSILGPRFFDDIREFFALLSNLSDGFIKRAQSVEELLHDLSITYSMATSPKAGQLRSRARFLRHYANKDLKCRL